MLISDRSSDVRSSSVISEVTREKLPVRELSIRPFGYFEEDLEVDFHQKCRPDLETEILACCISNREGSKIDRSFFWNLEIGKRIEYLLTLATLPTGSKINVNLRCLNLACREQMEITIPLVALTRLQQQSENKTNDIAIGKEKFSLRKPTGGDQLDWLEEPFSDEQSATLAMVKTLLYPEQESIFQQVFNLEEDGMELLNQAMEEIDPLVNFSLEIDCPYCGTENLQDFDLGAWALDKLYEAQQQLLITVHRLASHYHWSERDIFMIPPWRRVRYLTLINREDNVQ
jgi:hypothetical protein